MRVFFRLSTFLAVALAANLLCLGAWSQEAAIANQAPIIPDSEILKRTPVIDGVVNPGEWDLFQSFSQDDSQVQCYANWDSKFLYMAITSSKPVDAMVLIDANDDGWFHGEDNYEVRVVRQADGTMAKQVLRYESRNTSVILPAPVTENEASQVEFKTSNTNGLSQVEIKVPEFLIRNFKLADNKKIGLQIAVRTATDENSWIPETVRAETKQCVKSTLVSRKAAVLSPLTINFGVKDAKVAQGEDITCVLQINNPGAEAVDVRNITMAGDGLAAAYMDSIMKRQEGIEPKKQIKEEMKSSIPKAMPLGCWVVGAEIRSATNKLGAALASFEVMEQFEATLRLPKNDITTTDKEVTISVAVKNNMRKPLWGNVKVTLPMGWEFRSGISSRDYTVRTRYGEALISFRAQPPIGALGDIPISVSITGADTARELTGTMRVVTP